MEEQWSADAVLRAQGLLWDYMGKLKRKKALYTSARVPLIPDSATLEELARAAGKAAAETIVAATPNLGARDEAGSDPDSSSVPSLTSTSQGSNNSGPKPAQAEAKAVAVSPKAPTVPVQAKAVPVPLPVG